MRGQKAWGRKNNLVFIRKERIWEHKQKIPTIICPYSLLKIINYCKIYIDSISILCRSDLGPVSPSKAANRSHAIPEKPARWVPTETPLLRPLILGANLLDNAAFQRSNLPDPISSTISEIIFHFLYFQVNKNTNLSSMMKCKGSELGKGRRSRQGQRRSRLHMPAPLSLTSPRSYLILGLFLKCYLSELYVL